MSESNLWETTTGLVEKYRGTVTDAVYKWNEEYGRCQLELVIRTQDDDLPEDSPRYSVGKGWEPGDGGASVQREDGNPPTKGFNKASGIGRLIDAVVETGAVDALMAKNGPAGALQANTWIGLDADWERKSYEFAREGEETRTQRVMLPVKFHGMGGTAATPAKAEGPAVSAKVKAKLKSIAKESADFDTFQERAFEEVDEAENEAVAGLIEDEAFYAEAHAA